MKTTLPLLIHAIVGIGFPTMAVADMATRVGLARFTGNQHSESWEWLPDELGCLDDSTLEALYTGLYKAAMKPATTATQPQGA